MKISKKKSNKIIDSALIEKLLESSFDLVGPFWPLENLVAVNPLSGFDNLYFDDAIIKAAFYFQLKDIPIELHDVNRECIKWLQVFFDEGQSIFSLPNKEKGLFNSVSELMIFDKNIYNNSLSQNEFIKKLPKNPIEAIIYAICYLNIDINQLESFLNIVITSLPGWSSYVKYCCEYSDREGINNVKISSKEEYIALRLVIICLLWKDASNILNIYSKNTKLITYKNYSSIIKNNEKNYQKELLSKIYTNKPLKEDHDVKVQFVFCIDVRSEIMRIVIENIDKYKTYSMAGFFGVPLKVINKEQGVTYNSCPVIAKPEFNVFKEKTGIVNKFLLKSNIWLLHKRLYHALKYNFITPFPLAEACGFIFGALMLMRTFFPAIIRIFYRVINKIVKPDKYKYKIEEISIEKKVKYAKNFLNISGIIEFYSPLILICGHRGQTTNNAYETFLDCGACGGRHGGTNSIVISEILNDKLVRSHLKSDGIIIPESTKFIPAEHNTTTGEIKLYENDNLAIKSENFIALKNNLIKAKRLYNKKIMQNLYDKIKNNDIKCQEIKSTDWAQVRPEWGLANNASLIIAPRKITKNIDLNGRSFLHSYDYTNDKENKILDSIINAPLIVAHAINSQYLFSALDNVAYGSGSKITKNITGKIGVMQGNASDLMHGLSLQSLFISDKKRYHNLQRLTVIIYALKSQVKKVIQKSEPVAKLVKNEWIIIFCYDPIDNNIYKLNRDLSYSISNKTINNKK